MAIFALTVMTYIYGFIISIDVPYAYLLRETANGVIGMVVVFAIANSGWTESERVQLVKTVASALLCIGLFVGVLGAYKIWLFLSSGERLDFVVAASGVVYPWGTSLVSDYNFYTLTILAAILSALFLTTYARPLGQTILALLITFLLTVGTMAGSRRFWLIAPLMVAVQSFWMISRYGVRYYSVGFSVLLLCLIGLPVILYFVAGDVFELVFTTAWDLQYRFLTIFDVFDSDYGAGLGSRYELWAFAIDRLEGFVVWFGSGFDYLNRFSCEFGDCIGGAYPHMPILSAYLYGGWIAAVAAFTLYAYIILAGLRLLARKSAVAWLFFPMMAAFFFAAISANGPFSIRSHIILGALCVGFLRAANIDDESVRRGESIAYS